VRWFFLIAVISAATSAVAGPTQSNPAFLGIGPFGSGPGGCMIEGVSPGGAAAEAGMHSGDLVLAIDAIPLDSKLPAALPPCERLVAAITAHAAGDAVRIDVARGTQQIVLNATLTTRAEVLQKKVGHRMESTDVTDVDDPRHHFDLGERKSRTTVIGFFLQQCSNCARVFDRVSDGLKKRAGAAVVLGVTPRSAHDDGTVNLRKSFTAQVPLAIADNDTFEAMSMNDQERVFFMVTDCKGIIRIVAPIAPDADDLEASVDEVLAAAEQAEHTRTARR
jgi:hypothetical protein